MGGIRITMPVNGRGLFSITKRCRRQLGIWLMLNMFAWAVRQMIGVFDQLTVQGSRITGASYTAVHANIPVTFIMAALTAILGVVLGIWLMRSHTLEGQASIGVRASAALKAWRVPVTSIAVGGRGGSCAHRGMAGAVAALPRQPERTGDGIHLHSAQYRRHPRRLRS